MPSTGSFLRRALPSWGCRAPAELANISISACCESMIRVSVRIPRVRRCRGAHSAISTAPRGSTIASASESFRRSARPSSGPPPCSWSRGPYPAYPGVAGRLRGRLPGRGLYHRNRRQPYPACLPLPPSRCRRLKRNRQQWPGQPELPLKVFTLISLQAWVLLTIRCSCVEERKRTVYSRNTCKRGR